jgi:hypothetical protein
MSSTFSQRVISQLVRRARPVQLREDGALEIGHDVAGTAGIILVAVLEEVGLQLDGLLVEAAAHVVDDDGGHPGRDGIAQVHDDDQLEIAFALERVHGLAGAPGGVLGILAGADDDRDHARLVENDGVVVGVGGLDFGRDHGRRRRLGFGRGRRRGDAVRGRSQDEGGGEQTPTHREGAPRTHCKSSHGP